MKKPLPLSFLLVSFTVLATLNSAAQDFAPFAPESRKLFGSVPGYQHTFGIAFDSTTVNGGTTTYHNYMTVWDTLTTTSCQFWVGNDCLRQTRPTWAGARIEADGQGAHTMYNLWDEPIMFAFSTTPGSQTVLYADADEQFLLNYLGEVPVDVLGLTENVRQWSILHQDLGGQPINSALNNALVEVGENIGLIRYFRVDSFPLVLQPVELVGQSEPPLGLHTITPAFLEDYQAGDEVQIHDYADYYTGPPWLDYNLYVKNVVLSRSDSPTEVSYEMETTTYNVDSATEVVSHPTVTYSKTTVIATIPFDRFDGTQASLGKEDYCGLSLWTYRTYLNTGAVYCVEENCWGTGDTNGPPPQGGMTYVGGLGTYLSTASIFSPSGYTTTHGVVYFKKNGTDCFDEVIMGAPQVARANATLTLSPNPTDACATWTSTVPLTRMDVLDVQGALIASLPMRGTRGTMDTSTWPIGLYLLNCIGVDGSRSSLRMLVSR